MKKLVYAIGAMLIVNISLYSQCEPRVFDNQLNISINFDSGILTVSGLDCDICELGFEGSQTCECRNNCNGEEFEKCRFKCQSIQNEQAEEYCLEQCRIRHQEYFDCIEKCGELPAKEREAIDYDIQVNIWYNTGLTETFDGQPNVIAGTPIIFDDPPNSVNVNLNHKFPSEPISYCYLTQTTIFYNDGSCCVYFDFACFNLG